MAVFTESQQDQVKARPGATLCSKELATAAMMVVRGWCRGQLRAHTKNVAFRNRDARQQRFTGHAVVAVRMIGRDVALVAKEDEDLVPGKIAVLLREQGVDSARRVAAGQRHAETPPGPETFPRPEHQLLAHSPHPCQA